MLSGVKIASFRQFDKANKEGLITTLPKRCHKL